MLEPEDLVWVRNQIGDTTPPTDADLHGRYDIVGDRVLVVKEVLDRRLANLLSDPASFSVPGEYSQDVRDNIAALKAKLSELGGSSGVGGVRFANLGSHRR